MPVISISSDPATLTLVAIGEYPVPVARLWAAWTDPRQLERFWGPPEWPARFTRLELTAGGRANYFMTGPDGQTSHGYWVFDAIEAGHRFSLRDGFANPDGTPNAEFPETRMEVRFEATDGGSRFVITSWFPSLEAMEAMTQMGMVEGLRSALGQLDGVLAG